MENKSENRALTSNIKVKDKTSLYLILIILLFIIALAEGVFIFVNRNSKDTDEIVTEKVILFEEDFSVVNKDDTVEVIEADSKEVKSEETTEEWLQYIDKDLGILFSYPKLFTVKSEEGSDDLMMTYYVKSENAILKIFAFRAEGGPGVGGLTYLESYERSIKLEDDILGFDESYRIISNTFTGYTGYFSECVSDGITDCRNSKYVISSIFTYEAMDTSIKPIYLTLTVSGNPTDVEWQYFDEIVTSLSSL